MSILNKWPYLLGIILGVIAFSIFSSSVNDGDNVRNKYDGLVLSDETGQSYMLFYEGFGKFAIKEFDVEKMRLRNK